MLEVINLSKIFDSKIKAVNNVNLRIHEGEIYTMLGANGAGKTTIINLIFNFLQPSSGEIFVKGINVVKNPLLAKNKLAFVSENVMLYKNLTAIQNLDFFSKLAGMNNYSKSDYIDILNYVGLPLEAHNRRVKTFSKGMRQKSGIAIALAKEADLIVLDEPTSGLDPRSGSEFLKMLTEIQKKGKTIFMTTHDIFRAKMVSDRIGILKEGELVKEFDKSELIDINLETTYMEYTV